MKANFGDSLAFVLHWEGGKSDHPSDRGGKTNQGITQAVYDDWRIRNSLSRQPVFGLSADERDAIYRIRYWDAVRGDVLPDPVDLVMFDSAVNVGPMQAIKWLQRAVGANADGRIGPATLKAVAEADAEETAKAIIASRRDFYEYLVEKTPVQSVFLKGWLNRCDSISAKVCA